MNLIKSIESPSEVHQTWHLAHSVYFLPLRPSEVQQTVQLSPLELAGSGESPLEKGGECKVHQIPVDSGNSDRIPRFRQILAESVEDWKVLGMLLIHKLC